MKSYIKFILKTNLSSFSHAITTPLEEVHSILRLEQLFSCLCNMIKYSTNLNMLGNLKLNSVEKCCHCSWNQTEPNARKWNN